VIYTLRYGYQGIFKANRQSKRHYCFIKEIWALEGQRRAILGFSEKTLLSYSVIEQIRHRGKQKGLSGAFLSRVRVLSRVKRLSDPTDRVQRRARRRQGG